MTTLLNKKGSYFVFITLIFTAIMILVFASISYAINISVSSNTETLGRLWGRSILAEYDNILFDRYGLYGFYGNEVFTADKLNYYADYTVIGKKYVKYDGAEVSLADYCLTDIDVFKAQIEEANKYLPLKKGIESKPENTNTVRENREINAKWIINSLPSKGSKKSISTLSVISNISSLERAHNEVSELVFLFSNFKDYVDSKDIDETYFQNEIEYVLTGILNEAEAAEKVADDFVTLRNAMNIAYLYSCDEKRELANAIAELISPGPLATGIQALILETWAYLEAKNDLKIVTSGEKVPMHKTDDTWALGIENVISLSFNETSKSYDYSLSSGSSRASYVRPQKMEGLTYEDYLKIFAMALDQNVLVLRMMDLIQINLKYVYCDYFLLCDYFTGLDYSLTVNGRTHEFSESY